MQPDELLILTATMQGGYPEAGQGCEFSHPSRMSHLAGNRHHDIWRTTRLEHAQQINNWPGHIPGTIGRAGDGASPRQMSTILECLMWTDIH